MTSRGALVYVAVFCAALSAAVVAGEAAESHDAQGEQGGRMLLTRPIFTPAWVSHDGKVYALQGNFVSGNTLQAGDKGDQQANSVAVNNAQINKNSDANGAVVQGNIISSGRKLLTSTVPINPVPPRTITKDGKVYAFQGNLFSGNTVQAGDKGDQQANSVAANNAQINRNSDQNGYIQQSNIKV